MDFALKLMKKLMKTDEICVEKVWSRGCCSIVCGCSGVTTIELRSMGSDLDFVLNMMELVL